ncbi:aminomethyltransferase beta-barrel domain-containing protein [Streptomyces sp. SPB162]|uniref:aminomethyltransferase beta-barrel domain-containing protein n=1 Tax=Streptomyces sp. SPB162 TaxID=2940560 RepID=UPI003217119E
MRPRWCGTPPTGRATYTAQLRAHGEDVPVTAELVDGELLVDFDGEPVRGIAPGQAVVLYDGTRVVGSATIATTQRARADAARA